jgi:hypothetical protein
MRFEKGKGVFLSGLPPYSAACGGQSWHGIGAYEKSQATTRSARAKWVRAWVRISSQNRNSKNVPLLGHFLVLRRRIDVLPVGKTERRGRGNSIATAIELSVTAQVWRSRSDVASVDATARRGRENPERRRRITCDADHLVHFVPYILKFK